MSRIIHRRCPGFLLLEMILAIAVFSMAATGFIVALHRMAKVSELASTELESVRVLESALNEVLSLPTLEEGESDTEMASASIRIHRLIERVKELKNAQGMELQDMYRIRVTARWLDGDGQWKERSAETWRYGPMYQP